MFLKGCKHTKAWILSKYPNVNPILGDNNICFGYWYNIPNNKFRTFTLITFNKKDFRLK